nr:hypothetical protein [Mycolicibacterium agri]
MQLPKSVLRLLAVLLPRTTDAAKGGLNLVGTDAVAVVDDTNDRDRLTHVAFQHNRDGVGLGVDAVPDQLDDSAHRIALMGESRDEIIACLEYELGHEMTVWAPGDNRAQPPFMTSN